MKKRNFLATITTVAVAASMLSATAMNVSAASAYTAINGTTTPFNKYLVMKKDVNVPNATFSFSVKAGTAIPTDTVNGTLAVLAGVGTPTIADAVFTSSDSTIDEDDESADNAVVFDNTNNDDEKYAQKELTVDFTSVSFDEPGVYRYVITEDDTDNKGVTNDSVAERTLDVYVEDDNGTLKVAKYVMYSGEITTAPLAQGEPSAVTAGTKSNSYTNTYATQNLEFGKKVTGNQGSKDKYFKFTLTLNNVAGATLNVIPNGMEKEPTANSATIYDANTMKTANSIDENDSIDNQQIVVPTGENSVTKEFYLNDGQYVKIEGLPKGAEYTLTEDEEDYTQTNGTDKEWETGKTYNDATTGTINTDDIHTGFTNDRSGTIPTGVILSVAAPVIIGLAVLGGIIFLVIRNKKRENEDEED